MSSIPIETLRNFDDAVIAVIEQAERTIDCFDIDLAQSILPSARAVARLQAFLDARRNAALRLLLHDTGHLARDCPRLLDLYRLRGHQFTIGVVAAEDRREMQVFVGADGRHLATRFHADQPRGKLLLDDSAEVAPFVSVFEARMQAASAPTGLQMLQL